MDQKGKVPRKGLNEKQGSRNLRQGPAKKKPIA